MKDKMLKSLQKILVQEKRCFIILKKIALKKNKNILKQDIESLICLMKKEDKLIKEIENIEKLRKEALKSISKLYSLKENNLSYKELMTIIPFKWQEKIAPLKEDLLKIVEELIVINEKNRLLIIESIDAKKISFNNIQKIINYNKPTIKKNNSQLFDRRI